MAKAKKKTSKKVATKEVTKPVTKKVAASKSKPVNKTSSSKKPTAKAASKANPKKKTVTAKPVTAELVIEPEILTKKSTISKSASKAKGDAVRVKAEIVENGLATKASTDLAPLADGLSSYLANVNKYPLLTREQEELIAKRYYEEKNPKDAEILVTSNLRFVVKVAADYAKFGTKILDLIQEGNVGLMHAVKEFNPHKGVRLITYAVWWIRGYIQEYLMRQHSMVRIGTTQNQRKLFYHLNKEKNMLDQLGLDSSTKMIAEKLGVPEEDVRMMEERMSGGDVSLDAPVSGDNDTSRVTLESSDDDVPVDEEMAHRESLHLLEDKIKDLRPTLSEKEIILLEERLLAEEPVTLQDIGEKWGVTREAVRQMESRLLKKIKDEVLKAVNS